MGGGEWKPLACSERDDVHAMLGDNGAALSDILTPLACSSFRQTLPSLTPLLPIASPCTSVEPNVWSSQMLPNSVLSVVETSGKAQVNAQGGQRVEDEGRLHVGECDASDSDFVMVEKGSTPTQVNPSRRNALPSCDQALQGVASPADASRSIVALLIGSSSSSHLGRSIIRQSRGAGSLTAPCIQSVNTTATGTPAATDAATATPTAGAAEGPRCAWAQGCASRRAGRRGGECRRGEEEQQESDGWEQEVDTKTGSHVSWSDVELLASQLAAHVGSAESAQVEGHGGADGDGDRQEGGEKLDVAVRSMVVDHCGDEKGTAMETTLSWIRSLESGSTSHSNSNSKCGGRRCVDRTSMGPTSPTIIPVLVVTSHEAMVCAHSIPLSSACSLRSHTMMTATPSSACTYQDTAHAVGTTAAATAVQQSYPFQEPTALHVWRKAVASCASIACVAVMWSCAHATSSPADVISCHEYMKQFVSSPSSPIIHLVAENHSGESIRGVEDLLTAIRCAARMTGSSSSGGNSSSVGNSSRVAPETVTVQRQWPAETVERPAVTVERPAGTVERPAGTVERPVGTVEWPVGTGGAAEEEAAADDRDPLLQAPSLRPPPSLPLLHQAASAIPPPLRSLLTALQRMSSIVRRPESPHALLRNPLPLIQAASAAIPPLLFLILLLLTVLLLLAGLSSLLLHLLLPLASFMPYTQPACPESGSPSHCSSSWTSPRTHCQSAFFPSVYDTWGESSKQCGDTDFSMWQWMERRKKMRQMDTEQQRKLRGWWDFLWRIGDFSCGARSRFAENMDATKDYESSDVKKSMDGEDASHFRQNNYYRRKW